jgi:hypothetical protein
LVADYGHHEEQVEAEGPEDEEFGAFEVAAALVEDPGKSRFLRPERRPSE